MPQSRSESLLRGVTIIDNAGRNILYRYFQPTDDIDVITELLHEAYAALALQGMRFTASYQTSQTTRHRMEGGSTILAVDDGVMVGTITLKDAASTHGCAFYDRPDVAGFGQFAVSPSHQRSGIGRTLMTLVEELAREKGVATLALDTAETAAELISLYEAKGYRYVQHMKWRDTHYKSVVLAKTLT